MSKQKIKVQWRYNLHDGCGTRTFSLYPEVHGFSERELYVLTANDFTIENENLVDEHCAVYEKLNTLAKMLCIDYEPDSYYMSQPQLIVDGVEQYSNWSV